MFTVICSSCLYLESMENAPLKQNDEWGVGFVYSDRNKPEKNTVEKAAGRPE